MEEQLAAETCILISVHAEDSVILDTLVCIYAIPLYFVFYILDGLAGDAGVYETRCASCSRLRR